MEGLATIFQVNYAKRPQQLHRLLHIELATAIVTIAPNAAEQDAENDAPNDAHAQPAVQLDDAAAGIQGIDNKNGDDVVNNNLNNHYYHQ